MTESERLLREGFELAVETAELCDETDCPHDRFGSHINWTSARRALEECITGGPEVALTAETITNDQIREFQQSLGEAVRTFRDCETALEHHHVECGTTMCSTLCETTHDPDVTYNARARIADVLNARSSK